MKIKHQLLLTHGLLVSLSLIIVLSNVVAYKGMDSDAAIINQSGKLRALSYNMVQLSNRINNLGYNDDSLDLSADLQHKMDEFDKSLDILSDQRNPSSMGNNYNQAMVRLEKLTREWKVTFKPSYLNILKGEHISQTCEQINSEIDSYVHEIDEMVSEYSIYAREKIILALAINGGLVFIVILVTLYSFTSTNKRIRRPIKILMQELKELSLMDEDIHRKLKNINMDEISEMTQYFNEMMYDQLTKAFSRRSGLSKLSGMLQQGNRRQLKISLCFIDINGLKMVNDQLGHKSGDELIVSVIEGIRKEIREEDFIIRMGGDEFLIVFKNIDKEISEKIWDRIKYGYQMINENEARSYMISVSHGIVDGDDFERPDMESLIKSADDKMYEEKRYIKEELKIRIIR